MKKIALIFTLLFSAFSFADETTKARIIENVQIRTNGTSYFVSRLGWGAPSCPNAHFIHVNKADGVGADAILSLALSSQAQNRAVYAIGNCLDAMHFKLNYLIQEPK